MKPIARLALAVSALGALTAGIALAPPARAETVDEKVAAFKEYLKTSPDSQGIRNQIADLALLKDAKVVPPLMQLLENPKMDDEVKIAVLQSVGKQGDKAVAVRLLAKIDSKPWEEKTKLIAAALEGVGDADAATHYKEIMKLAKKYLDINGDIASAGYRAAAMKVDKDTVEDLVKELQRADYVTQNDNAQKKAARGLAKPVINELLKKMTGQNIDDANVWKKWWDENKKTWKPVVPGKDKPKDINASETFTDTAYAFEIKKPNKVWSFRQGAGQGPYLTMEALEDGQRAAWVELVVQGTKNLRSKTPELYAKEVREGLEGKFRDFKSAEWERKCMYGGQKGVEHLLFGQHKDHDTIRMHNVFVENSEVMYAFMCVYKNGKKASLETDIEDILKSFKLTR